MVNFGGKFPGRGNERLFEPRWSSVRFGRLVAKAGIGPDNEVFVRERIWRDDRSGEEDARDVKKDRPVPSGWELITRFWSWIAESDEGSVSCMCTFEERVRDLSCLTVEKTSGREPVRPVF